MATRSRKYELAGQRFGRWIVVDWATGGWRCKCRCGREAIVSSTKLLRGRSRGCIMCRRARQNCESTAVALGVAHFTGVP